MIFLYCTCIILTVSLNLKITQLPPAMITSYLMGPFIEKFLWNKKEKYMYVVYLKQIINENNIYHETEWIEISLFFSSIKRIILCVNKPQGLYFSKAPFEGLIFGGAHLRKEICVSKPIGLALYLEVIYRFGFVLLCGAYIWRGDLMEGFLRYQFGGLIFGGAYFRNFTVTL